MSPTTTEAILEEELSIITDKLENIRTHIRYSNLELQKLFDKQVEYLQESSLKMEELRKFRAMYPSVCRQTKE